ncbi:3-phosphoshikimate 1-carboxyvinyltransferase [Nostoc sp. CHAB 5824]|nr:3-phosphoshikimate 1-carboxyvinyltransferase [Nostoc sp. CHAB 5824]
MPSFSQGKLRVTGDKSISHRVLLVGAATPGITQIHHLNHGSAVKVLIPTLQALGVNIEQKDAVTNVYPPSNGLYSRKGLRLNLGASSAAARLLLGLLSGLGINAIVDGDTSLQRQPMEWVIEPLRELGVDIRELGTPGHLPVEIAGGQVYDGKVHLSVGSAQARSAILLAAFGSGRNVEIKHLTLSRDHTIRLLRYIGINIQNTPEGVRICGGRPRPLPEYIVPSDPSAAAYLVAAHVFQRRKDELVLENVGVNPTRIGFFNLLKECGIPIRYENVYEAFGEPVGNIIIGEVPNKLKPFQIKDDYSFHSMIDEIPLAAAIATLCSGQSAIYGAAELLFKETNRLISTRDMLSAFGSHVEIVGDSLLIFGDIPLKHGIIPSFRDHRIAMTAVALACSFPGRSRILEGSCYKTSFPDFTELMRCFGFDVYTQNHQ